MSSTLPKICLNMIVKNESHIIEETLECISKYIDYYVISDTGSTDNTVEVINNFFNKKNIPGEIHLNKWKNFGYNRSLALNLCHHKNGKPKAKYIWIIDADDIIVGDLKLPILTEDCYMLSYGDNFKYERTQIFKNSTELSWKYVGVLHEYPECKKKNYTTGYIKGNYYIDSRRLGNRSTDPNKYLNDAKTLEAELEDDPTNERNVFYLAQSYYDHGDFEKSLENYQKRASMGGWYEEVYYSLYRAGIIKVRLNYPTIEIEKIFYDAYKKYPHRAETLYELAHYYRNNNNFELCYRFAKLGSTIPYPVNDKLFVFKEIYDYKIIDELSIAAYYIGKYSESYKLCKRLLTSEKLPKYMVDRIKQNLEFAKNNVNKSKICVVYIGNMFVDSDSKLWKVVEIMSQFYNMYLVGSRVYVNENSSDTIKNMNFIDQAALMLMTIDKVVDVLLIYNDLNFFYNNKLVKLEAKKTVLWQLDNSLRLVMNNGLILEPLNPFVLDTIVNKINYIICDDNTKNILAKNYNLPQEQFYILKDDKDENLSFLDEDNPKLDISVRIINRENYGYNYNMQFNYPFYIKKILEKKNMDNLEKLTVINFLTQCIKDLPLKPEPIYELVKFCFNIGNNNAGVKYLEKVEKLIKNEKKYCYLQNMIDLYKAKLLCDKGEYQKSFNKYNQLLKSNILPDEFRSMAEAERDKNIEHIKDKYLEYPTDIVNQIVNRIKDSMGVSKSLIYNLSDFIGGGDKEKVLFSITTCKRFDLFKKTMNSFLNCCLDLDRIDQWLCIDDNSSLEDREKMKKFYPFFDFVWKDETQKGHYKSMNMILDHIDESIKYLLHMEDDFHFIEQRNFVTESTEIIETNENLGQVLFNRNYAEIERNKQKISGGEISFYGSENKRFIVHEYYKPNTPEYKDFIKRNGETLTVGYWPHFSFRPSLYKCSVLRENGIFHNSKHFEMDYAKEYIARGYKSAFLDTFSCIHIGKKTWEKDNKNAYNLNNQSQFSINNKVVDIRIISSNDNMNRWKKFKEKSKNILPYYSRDIIEKVTTLSENNKHLFVDFLYEREAIFQTITHIGIWKNMEKDFCLVLEDSIDFGIDFDKQLEQIIIQLKKDKYDLTIIGFCENGSGFQPNLLNHKFKGEEKSVEKSTIEIKNFEAGENDNEICGYIISREGANKILKYLETYKFNLPIYKCLPHFSCIDIYVTSLPIVGSKVSYQFNKMENLWDNYKFYRGLDSHDSDIGYYKKSIKELKDMCDADDNCVGFNSLGWLKFKIKPEETLDNVLYGSINLDDGLYVKKK